MVYSTMRGGCLLQVRATCAFHRPVRALVVRLSIVSAPCPDAPSLQPLSPAMSDDELDRLIDMEPSTVQAGARPDFAEPFAALSQPDGAEPFAAHSPMAARPLPLALDEESVCTPAAKKRDQLEALLGTPPQTLQVKRRICGKRADTAGNYGGKPLCRPRDTWTLQDQEQFMSQSSRGQYLAFMYRLRRWVATVQPGEAPEGVLHIVFQCRDASFQLLSSAVKAELVRGFLEATCAPDWARDWAASRWHLASGGKAPKLHAKTALLTYQGDYGLVPVEKYLPLVCVDTTCSQMRADPMLQQLWADLVTFSQWLCTRLAASNFACSVELCTKTFGTGKLRVHCHIFLKKEGGRITVTSHQIFKFRDCQPHVKGDDTPWRSRGGSGSWAGAYYLQAPKIGVLFQFGSKLPFEEYPVSGKWVFQLVQMEKITFSAARQELIKTGENLCRVLPDLDKHHAESTAARLHKRATEVQQLLAATASRSVRLPEVEAWKARFGRGVWRRKKFLVLEGKSGTGKTQFVRGLYGTDKTLELNCAGVTAVNLRDYRPLEHKVVLWDEASPELVLENRKLFQCPPCWIDLGHSATGTLVYKVWVNEALFVIATNRWSSALQELVREDREWLQANQVHVLVDHPLWVEDDDDW